MLSSESWCPMVYRGADQEICESMDHLKWCQTRCPEFWILLTLSQKFRLHFTLADPGSWFSNAMLSIQHVSWCPWYTFSGLSGCAVQYSRCKLKALNNGSSWLAAEFEIVLPWLHDRRWGQRQRTWDLDDSQRCRRFPYDSTCKWHRKLMIFITQRLWS
jgi:hypothetical protein